MHVLFLTRKWPPAIGGMEVYSVEMAAAMRAAGHDVDLRALPGRPDGGAPGAAALIGFGLRTGLAVLLRPRRWDAILGGDLAVWPLVWLAGLRRPGATRVVALHGNDIVFADRPGIAAGLYRFWRVAGARALRGARFVANSKATADRAVAAGLAPVSVVPLGCSVSAPAGEVPDGRYLLFVGRRVRRKGLGWFVDTVLPRLDPAIRLVVAGPPWHASEETALRHGARVVHAGLVSDSRRAALMQDALAVVVPNLAGLRGELEGFGLIAAEAAAAGGVVLAARSGGLDSAVIDGETGFLLPPGDADAWAAAIADVAAWSAGRRAAFVARAQATARARFDWAATARATLALAEGAASPGRDRESAGS